MSTKHAGKKTRKLQTKSSKKHASVRNAQANKLKPLRSDADSDGEATSFDGNESLGSLAEEDESQDESDQDITANLASPLKRKRTSSFAEAAYDSDTPQTPASLTEFDLADLGDSEDDLDIEQFEGEAMIQEEEDKDVLKHNFEDVDESQPFAYAPDDESEHSNSEENWVEDFDALASGRAPYETQVPAHLQLKQEESQDYVSEDDFFLWDYSSEDGDDSADEEDGDGDEDDRVGWECFFSTGESDSASDEEDQEGSTTDDEAPALIIAKHQAAKANAPVTPAAKLPAKSELTSCLKQAAAFNDATPSKTVVSTPVRLNTDHKPPPLGTFPADSHRRAAFIDGRSTLSPGGFLPSAIKTPSKRRSRSKASPKLSPAVNDAMTSLDDIMYTNDFVAPLPKSIPSKFDMPVHVGAFRKGQQRSMLIKEGSFRDEFYIMKSRNKAKSGGTKSKPILGIASESLSRKEKRKRKKMRSTMGSSVGGSVFGGSTFGGSIDETSDNDLDDGIERAGLGLGVPVESLFLFHEL